MIYLDNNATTMLDPAVREAMRPFLEAEYCNPSSPYTPARAAALAIGRAREEVAGLVGAEPDQIVFTSGGTESNNAAIRSMLAADPSRKKLVMTRVEHASVLKLGEQIERSGRPVAWLDVDAEGRLDLEQARKAITPDTAGVSVMLANNETGVVFPVAEVAKIARSMGALVHTDAVQAVGKIPVSVRALGADYVSIGAHKFHGPKGVGAIYARKGAPWTPFLVGGDQESGRRAGTENVAGVVGLGKAAGVARGALAEGADARIRAMRDGLEGAVLAQAGGARVVGRGVERLPNTALVLFEGVESEALLALLDMDGICCSSGSACAAGASEPSHVLRAMGVPSALAHGALRISLSRFTTAEEGDALLASLIRHIPVLRQGP